MAIETIGAYGEGAWQFLLELGRRLKIVSQDSRATSFLFQRLSVAMQRGNAACVLGTVADSDSASDFFFSI